MISGPRMSGGGLGGGGGSGGAGGADGGRRGPDGGQLHLPPGFRFYPSDEELVVHYLCKKAASQPFAVPIIAEVDLYKFDPWDLPAKALFGEKEWYFFSPRDRKYPNGSRPNRAAGSGYWKATGTDKPISSGDGQKVGVKKALVFYAGRPPKGEKTNWIMHEYRLAPHAASKATNAHPKGSLRLDDWVLCRIYKKLPSATRLAMQKEEATSEDVNVFEEVLEGLPQFEEDRKLGIARTTPPMMSLTTPYSSINGHTNSNNFYKPSVQMGSQQSQILDPFSVGGEGMNKSFLKGPLMNYEGMDRPCSTTRNYNYTFNFPTRPLVTIPNLTPEHSPVSSSVDEERELPVEQGGLPAIPPFNFDALPSPFGRLESLHQSFPF